MSELLQLPESCNLRTPIAVIGIGCWYPGARTPLQLWENILSRRLEFRSVPDIRLPLEDYCDPSGESIDKSYAQRVAVLDGFEFDWAGRRIPKSMYESTDIVHWLALEVAEQALVDAGYTSDTIDRDGTGVIVGNTLTGDITRAACMRLRWPFVRRALKASCKAHGLTDKTVDALESSMETLYKSVFAPPTADTLAGGLANTIAGRVCNYFDLHGGGYIVDGACSSSLLAVCTAGRALSMGDLNVALVGGIDISIDPFELVGFSRAGALSKGEMNVYDRAAAGFIAGEGCGFVVLKRLEDARHDRDQVYAVMRGWGISSDGKGGIMTPSSGGQAMAIRRSYVGAGYTPADLDFVEGHGTGTRVGDQIELRGVYEAQTQDQPAPHRRTGMTSLKSIVGHTKAAAGIGAFIKATMAVNRRILPPTGSCTDPNQVFRDTCSSLYPLIYGKVADPASTLRAGVSAMGFGGINSHVTLESGDAPISKIAPTVNEATLLVANQTSELFVMTATSFEQLAAETAHWLSMARRLSGSDLIDLASDLSKNASHRHPIRAAVVAGTVDQLVNGLESLTTLLSTYPPVVGEFTSSTNRDVWLSNQCDASRVGFLFPGQSSQQLLMARKLAMRFSWAGDIVAAADRVQAASGLPTYSEVVFADVQRAIDREQSTALRHALARTEVAQVAIVTASVIYARYLGMLGIKPVVCGGHSLGELTALHLAGAFDLDTLLRLASLRGRAMSCPAGQAGAMAAMFCSRDQAEAIINEVPGYIVLANVNSPKQIVVSGDEAAITATIVKATAMNVSVARLNVSNAFHSKYVDQAAEMLRQHAPVPPQPQRLDIEIYSCMDGQRLSSGLDLREHLARQVVNSVDFVALVEAVETQCDMLIEVGPNDVLSKLCKEILPWSDVDCSPTGRHPDVDCELNRVLAKAFVHGVDIQWQHLFEGRIARPFVPIDNRKFIGNPCESPFVEIGPVSQLTMLQEDTTQGPQPEVPQDALLVQLTQHTGLSQAALSQYVSHRGDFLADVIGADLRSSAKLQGHGFSTESQASNATQDTIRSAPASSHGANMPRTQAPVPKAIPKAAMPPSAKASAASQLASAQVAPNEISPNEMTHATHVDSQTSSRNAIEAMIIDIIHERTSFPRESITTDLRLLDDLNLDSIKAGDIIASAARKIGALGPIDPASLADATIADVVAAVRAAAGEGSEAERDTTIPAPNAARTAPALSSHQMANGIDMRETSAPSSAPDRIAEAIIEIIHERTGFAKETLSMDLRLLDDLNLDSIKAGDIIASAARRLGALGPIDPASMVDATIGDVVVAVRQAKEGSGVTPASAMSPGSFTSVRPAIFSAVTTNGVEHTPVTTTVSAPRVASVVRRIATHADPADTSTTNPEPTSTPKPRATPVIGATAPSWVRNFAIELVPHRANSVQNDLTGRHYRVLYDPSQQAFVDMLAKRLRSRHAAVSMEEFENEGHVTGDSLTTDAPYCVIAVLPKVARVGTGRERLQRMVHRLRRSVANTNPLSSNRQSAGVTFVQFGDGNFGNSGTIDIECCTAAGFARAVHLESPALQVRVIDFADKLSDFLATDFLTNELAAADTFRDATYDYMGRRHETRHRLLQPTEDRPLPLMLNESDVILVTGGARGITAECTYALAKKTGANVALVGTSPHPSQSPGAATDEIASTLHRFASLPGKCEYFSCDLTDEIAVRNLVAEVDTRLGKITGVVHGAGRNMPKMASASGSAEVFAEVSPKVLGAINVLGALGDRPLRCVVGLTSIIGVTGIPGNSWYAFSNETLDLLLRQYKSSHPETLVRSISYSAWSEVGMGAKGQVETNLRRMGVGMIPPSEGVARFMHALEHELSDIQMIVTGSLGGIDTWRPSDRDKCSKGMRYLGELTSFEPGVSLTTRVILSHKHDPYLLDHIYDGTCLFPAVFGMEAMAQAASHLMSTSPNLVRIQNIDLHRPIIVGAEGEVELEIRANARETDAEGETIVSVSIRTERTQFQYDHFAAEIVFGIPSVGAQQPERIGERLDIDPQKDLYSGILFQGPRFQRWGDTYHLEEGRVTFDVRHSENTVRGKDVFGESVDSKSLLTGDPFYRDVLLQSVQAVIPQKTGLPLSIGKIEFFTPAKSDSEQANRRLVTSVLHVIAEEVGKEHVCEVVAKDPFGQIRERIVGYRVKVLAIKDTNPSAAQLASLEAFDQGLLDEAIATAFANINAKAPLMLLQRMPELHQRNREQRHRLERPMMEEAIQRYQAQTSGNHLRPVVDWLPSGKPYVSNDPQCKISLSHDDDYCLCVVNAMVAACDIAPITARSRDQWASLVGPHNAPLLDELVALGDSIDQAGTRIWGAVEAVQKAIDQPSSIPLKLQKSDAATVCLVTDQLDNNCVLITTIVSLHRKPDRIIAIVAPATTKATPAVSATAMSSPAASATAHLDEQTVPTASPNASSPHHLIPGAKNEPSLRVDVAAPGETRSIDNVKAMIKWDGPQDQAVFEHRFVVTFKECAMRGKHVQHTQFLGWMGSMRENGLLYLVPDMVIKLSDGLSGMATNWTEVDVVGEAMMGDIIVARLWMESMTEASVCLCCDFAKALQDGRLERLATVRQATTWVRLDGRNDPVKEPFPKFLADAFRSMAARSEREFKMQELPESLGRLKIEQRKLEAVSRHAPIKLWGEDYQTCMDDSNIVANIYYTRYFHWQWRTSDLYFFSVVPNLMSTITELGNVRELVPLNSRIDFIRDAFPFDRIRTELSVTRSTDCAATLQFIHYRLHDNGHQEKLSVGSQDVVWIRRTPSGSAAPEPFPLAVREAFGGRVTPMEYVR